MLQHICVTSEAIKEAFPEDYFANHMPQEVVSQALLCLLTERDVDAVLAQGLCQLGLATPSGRISAAGREYLYARYRKKPRHFARTKPQRRRAKPPASHPSGSSAPKSGSAQYKGELDPHYQDVVRLAKLHGQFTVDAIKNTFRVEYNRARSMVAAMETRGLVTAPDANGVRVVLDTAHSPKGSAPVTEESRLAQIEGT